MATNFEHYGKMREPKRRRNAMNEKGKEKEKESGKEGMRGYMKRFNGKPVELKLITGDIISGELKTNAYNKVDVLLKNSEGCFLIPKHAIVFLHEKGGGDS